MIKAVLFDLDGTLLNRDESLKKFVTDQYERLQEVVGHIPQVEYISRFIELDHRGYVWKDKVYQQLVQDFSISKINWEELLEDYLAMFKYHCVPFPNLISMLEELKGRNVLLGIITNGMGQFQLDNIRALGIEQYFNTVLISEWEGMNKPDPLIFARALDRLGVLPIQTAFVGDHPDNDVKAAQKAGMKGIWKRDLHWDQVKADYIIEDLGEIPLLIKK